MYVRVGCNDGDVRLVGGNSIRRGTVEICINEIWGLIADNGWDDTDATVICKQLGYNISESKLYNAYDCIESMYILDSLASSALNSTFGKPRNVVYMDYVHCDGTEDKIVDCEHVLYDFDTGKDILQNATVAGVNCSGTIHNHNA